MIDWLSVKQAADKPFLYLGTTNPGKIKEMSALLESLDVEPRTLDGLPEVEENARSYKGNALLKAKAFARLHGVPVLSEDSGLGVRALNGAPGLRSGRFSGSSDHNSKDNASRLLEALKGVKDRRAAFVTAAAIADGDNSITATRRKPGLITESPRGDKGFSYDTVFVPQGSDKTYAESGDKSDSSRDRAVKAVVAKYLGKQAADIAAPDEGFADNNRKANPIPVDPMRRIRNEAREQKLFQVPAAYAKGVAQDMADPQAWRDAVESVGTQWNRAWHGRVPYAHMLYKGPISEVGKAMAGVGEKLGWMTPQQAQQQRATWDWWTQPQREQIAEIEKRYPYAQRLENNPYYKPFGQMAPEFIAAAGINEAAKAVTGLARTVGNTLRRKPGTSMTTSAGLRLDARDGGFQNEMRTRPEYRSLIEKADRSNRIAAERWNQQQDLLDAVPVNKYMEQHRIPERLQWKWVDGKVNPSRGIGAKAERTWYTNLSKPDLLVQNDLYNPWANLTTPLVDVYDKNMGRFFKYPKLKLTDTLKHELGHIRDYERLGRGPYFPRVKEGPLTDFKTIINPYNAPQVMTETAADTFAFASPKTGKLSKFAQLRHHPEIQTYLTWEKIAAMERMRQRGKTLSEAATAAAGAYPFLNVKDSK